MVRLRWSFDRQAAPRKQGGSNGKQTGRKRGFG